MMGKSMQPITRQTFSSMRRILRAVEARERSLKATTGLTSSQLMLLQHLDGAERMARDLAKGLGVNQATATVMIQRLEARGLLSRRPGTDRRQTLLSLSDAGREALEAAPDPLQAEVSSKLESLPEWEQLMIGSALLRIAELMDTDDDAAPLLDSAPVLNT
ncbi:MarR family transcriptional regulator [Pseudomonas sp. GX19020]|uniref:MarR family winged helix-turn-helix transcriptional regulator n=1 Tax=Pseudomonas sp. GX19020 TaxID=2942277 RepID=UPI0020198D19|nr:MarR family transcriptional regulator [Pseudomonas sp. GX19020]MCL4068160.1 MarR family transcriptional regulator [Pseudomonas sp. GX19020]